MGTVEPEKITGGGVLLTFPEPTSSSPQKELPPRLKQRLVVQPRTPLSDEYVHNKLKEADLQRQIFYELLVSKAKPKVKKVSNACLKQENLARRLQAKLIAAEQKGKNFLISDQLSRIKILGDAQMRLSNQNELRQACKHGRELQAEKQRGELGMKVIYRIQQAETNRMILLEACTHRIAAKRERAAESLSQKMSRDIKYRECKSASIYQKRADAERRRTGLLEAEKKRARAMILKLETKRKRMKDKLEDRLQRAMKQRNEHLRQRRTMTTRSCSLYAERTTTIQTVKAFVGRLESRLMISEAVIGNMCNRANIDHLLQHVAFPTHRDSSSKVFGRRVKSIKPGNRQAQKPVKLSRYLVRVLVCAYMIIGHPDIVFSGQSENETTLAESAANFIREFELLIKIIINGPIRCTKDFQVTIGSFDRAWCFYLHHFVDWKSEDAKLLERDLVRAACQLELSKQEVEMLERQASEKNHMHTKASDRQNSENLQKSSNHLSERSSVSISCNSSSLTETCQRSGNKGCPSFDIDGSFLVKGVDSLPSRNATGITDRGLSLNLMFSENELLVNEIIHEHQSRFADGLDAAPEDHNSLKARVRETMEKAFLDGVLESMKNDEPDFSWVLKLMKEVRDELYEMSPQPWRKEISETIDVDILEQTLNRQISRAHIKLLEPVIRGPAGLEYLKMAFANRHGPPDVEQEWHEHMDYLCDFTKDNDSSGNLFPSTLQIGGTTYSVPEIRSSTSNAVHDQPECPKESMGLLVRLGLLKLVNRVEGLTLEDLPETLKLNVFRLRTVQLPIQKIIVISISLMVKNWVANSADMEYIVSQCFEQLCKLVDGVEEVGLSDIIEKINGTPKGCNQLLDIDKVQDSRTIMANMLAKSLQAGDAVYTHVSRSIYLALRGGVFGRTGLSRRRLVEAAFRRVRAAVLADRVIKAAEVLIVIASVLLKC
ncbi:hypothetical protein K2173_009267 [Erythroxylum novogranatense]|uniref:T-complex protein 11 n=1 Tax=Erythroxylum novogranatense TaxID=1862640 RepID=A0AAV8SZZ3_9ROSI|nr:hypothetical protein K2173_009267 [Erythroxylum novogranatense]